MCVGFCTIYIGWRGASLSFGGVLPRTGMDDVGPTPFKADLERAVNPLLANQNTMIDSHQI